MAEATAAAAIPTLPLPLNEAWLLNAPAVATLTLLESWDDAARQSLDDGLRALLEANPLLTGALLPNPGGGEGAIHVVAGRHDVRVVYADAPEDIKTVPTGLTERLQLLHILEPLFKLLPPGAAVLASGGPVFGLTVVTLPGGFAAVGMSVSHSVVDGYAYYQLQQKLDDYCHGRKTAPLTWRVAPAISSMPAHYSEDTVKVCNESWIPTFLAQAATFVVKPKIEIINKEAVQELKKEFIAEAAANGTPVPFLSTNDIITAGVAEVVVGSEAMMFANMRGRTEFKFCRNFACNFERGIHHPTAQSKANPAFIRRVLATDFVYYDEQELKPDKAAYLANDLAVTTSWATITKCFQPASTHAVAHVPPVSFLMLPLEICIIFSADVADTVALFTNFERDAEFDKRFVASRIFRRMVSSSKSGGAVEQ